MANTFHKSERLCSRKAVEALFAGGSRGFTVWPLRAVWRTVDVAEPQDGDTSATAPAAAVGAFAAPLPQVLIVAPKRRLRHAVDRNRAKRQIREAYRLQKGIVAGAPAPMHLAFIWIADTLVPSERVHKAVSRILHHIAEAAV